MSRFTRVGIVLSVVVLSALFFVFAQVPSASGIFGPMNALQSARDGASAAVLADGSILITGGTNSSGALATAEYVNGGTAAAMTTARSGHASVTLADGRVLVVGFHA